MRSFTAPAAAANLARAGREDTGAIAAELVITERAVEKHVTSS